jgi:hypothetical protein
LPNSLKVGADLSGIDFGIPTDVRAAVCTAAARMDAAIFSTLVGAEDGTPQCSTEQWIKEAATDRTSCGLSFVRVFCAAFKTRVHIVCSYGKEMMVGRDGSLSDEVGEADIHLAYFSPPSGGCHHYDVLAPVRVPAE